MIAIYSIQRSQYFSLHGSILVTKYNVLGKYHRIVNVSSESLLRLILFICVNMFISSCMIC